MNIGPKLTPYLERLLALPFVEGARILPDERPGEPGIAWDAVLELRVEGRRYTFRVEHKRTPRLNRVLIEALFARVRRHADARWILFTPHVTTQMAARLREGNVDYVDLAGNCHVAIDRKHIAMIEGRRPPPRTEETQKAGPSRYQVLFALLAKPETTNATVRDLAAQAGVGKSVAATTVRRLLDEGLIGRAATKTLLLEPRELLERWLTGYVETLRPHLLVGHFRGLEREPMALERHLEQAFAAPPRDRVAESAGVRWAWGGTAAALRLTGHYRGERTVLHVEDWQADLAQRLRLIPARDGEITILRAPGPIAFEGAAPDTVHPLLVYAELLAADDPRAREAADALRDRYLQHLA